MCIRDRSKLYAFEAGFRAIMEHYHRMGIEAEKVEKGVDYGIYHTTFKIKDDPLVSVIIPNKDHRQDLDPVSYTHLFHPPDPEEFLWGTIGGNRCGQRGFKLSGYGEAGCGLRLSLCESLP